MTGPKVRKEDYIRTIADGIAIWWWWIGGCSTDEGYRDGSRERVGGGVCGCFGLGVSELVTEVPTGALSHPGKC